MNSGILSLINRDKLDAVLQNLSAFLKVSITLTDQTGKPLYVYGEKKQCCIVLQTIESDHICFGLYARAAQRAQNIGTALVFSCQGAFEHMVFPLIDQNTLLGGVIIGPFSLKRQERVGKQETRYCGACPIGERCERGDTIPLIEAAQVDRLKVLVENLLVPLLPSEMALRRHAREELIRQAIIDETIQMYLDLERSELHQFLRKKEMQLLAAVRLRNKQEVNCILDELVNHVLFFENTEWEYVRQRANELGTMLSRILVTNGVKTEIVYRFNGKYFVSLEQEQNPDNMYLLLRNLTGQFMHVIFCDNGRQNLYIRQALEYVAENYSERLTLESVARQIGLSYSYFSKLFCDIVGIGFRDYLLQYRIEKSKQMLNSSEEKSMAEIAVAVGFPNQSYYCRAFKRVVGTTPGKFRAAQII